jgi:hypothetical protein
MEGSNILDMGRLTGFTTGRQAKARGTHGKMSTLSTGTEVCLSAYRHDRCAN